MANKIYFIKKISIIISLSILFFSIFYIKNGNACSTAYLNFGCNGYKSCGPVFSSGWWFLGVCVGGDGNWVCDSVSGYDCTWSLCGPTPCSVCSGSQWVYDWASTSACPTGTGTNGGQCEVRGGNCCDTVTSGTWDRSEGKCMSCSGRNENTIYGSPSGIWGSGTAGDKECESACGASADCDEKCKETVASSSVYCDSNCNSVTCDSSRNCGSVEAWEATWCHGGGSVGGDQYCTYDGSSWAWRSSYPTEVCTDSYDNDCDGINNCADPSCAGKTGPSGVCCQSVSDCPACPNHEVKTCYSNTCHCDPCMTSSGCEPNYCCEKEKGGSQTCRYLGWVYGNAYLCI